MSKKVAVLSDTHGLLRPEVLEQISGCDIILHAGDINNDQILDTLRSIASIYVVRGNNDKEWAEHLARSQRFSIEGVRLFMVHNPKDIPPDLKDIDVIIYGHTHRYVEEMRNGILYLNPGSCGRRRFDQEITFAMLTIDDTHLYVEKNTI